MIVFDLDLLVIVDDVVCVGVCYGSVVWIVCCMVDQFVVVMFVFEVLWLVLLDKYGYVLIVVGVDGYDDGYGFGDEEGDGYGFGYGDSFGLGDGYGFGYGYGFGDGVGDGRY